MKTSVTFGPSTKSCQSDRRTWGDTAHREDPLPVIKCLSLTHELVLQGRTVQRDWPHTVLATVRGSLALKQYRVGGGSNICKEYKLSSFIHQWIFLFCIVQICQSIYVSKYVHIYLYVQRNCILENIRQEMYARMEAWLLCKNSSEYQFALHAADNLASTLRLF